MLWCKKSKSKKNNAHRYVAPAGTLQNVCWFDCTRSMRNSGLVRFGSHDIPIIDVKYSRVKMKTSFPRFDCRDLLADLPLLLMVLVKEVFATSTTCSYL